VAFSIEMMEWLFDVRQPALKMFMQFCTSVGDVQGYVFVFSLFFMAFDKALALRFGVVALLAMSINHLLKELIQNPRPFVESGLHLERWAVSAEEAHSLALEFSTPSGHAMAAAAAYGYLAVRFGQPYALAMVALIGLIGVSRSYLGVHYVEDVVLGWTLGAMLALAALRYGDAAMTWIGALSVSARASLALIFSASVWGVTAALSNGDVATMPRAFVGELGFQLASSSLGRGRRERTTWTPRAARLWQGRRVLLSRSCLWRRRCWR
jgi:membrane-associated phospholipid phosphatase